MLPTIPHWEARGLVFSIVRNLLQDALRQGDDELADVDDLRLCRILKHTAFRVGKPDPQVGDRSANSLAALRDIDGDRFDADKVAKVVSFVESLVSSFFIFVESECPVTDNAVFVYEHQPETYKNTAHGVEKFRAKHGLSPYRVDVPMLWALVAESFHFQLVAPTGTWVRNHTIEEVTTNRRVDQEHLLRDGHQQYARLYRKQGQAIAHLHIRRQRPVTPAHSDSADSARLPARQAALDIKSVVELREVPPGSLGVASTIAFAIAVILGFLALTRVGLDPVLDGSTVKANNDIPAFMLALPIFLAAVLGRGINGEVLSRATLTAFYGLWLSVFLGVVGVLLYIYSAYRGLPWDIRVQIFGVDHTFSLLWLVLAACALLNYLYLRKEKNERRRQYFATRPDMADGFPYEYPGTLRDYG